MLKILCVEDDYIASYSLHERIERMGYFIVDKVESGEDALKLCVWLKPDLVLMDIRLAGEMDGIETAKKISEQEQIPIIFVTGISDVETHKRAKALNPHGFFTKPLEIGKLQDSLEQIFVKQKYG